jgi:MFS transporter, YNFM family, putative membrane transport protein
MTGGRAGLGRAGQVSAPVAGAPRPAMSGFLVGAAAMFATMYSTQAILPEIGRDFGVSPSRAGLTVAVVIAAVAVGGWLWGPVSDRVGRRRAITVASGLLVVPTALLALAPGFGALLALRALQGLCMPGLLTVGVPYVAEVFAPAIGGRAMGAYTAALVCGGLVGRVGVGLATTVVGWRVALGMLALLPLAATLLMRRRLPEGPPVVRHVSRRHALRAHLANLGVLRATVVGAGMFFGFVGSFTYIAYRLEAPPFGYGQTAISLLFVLWVLGAAGPTAGRLADRAGWRRVAACAAALALAGLALSLTHWLAAIVAGLGLVTLAMFSAVPAAQLGLSEAADADRGVASALYFTVYYVAGALASWLPGLAWEAWGWPGVVAAVAVPVSAALVAAALGRRPRSTGA